MRGLVIATVILGLLALPAGVGLVGTAERYLATTRDLAGLRVEVVGWRPAATESSGYRRAFAGPDVTLRFSGIEQTALTLVELNFDLVWRGARLGTASSLLQTSIPRDAAATVTVQTNLEPGQEGRLAELLARDGPGLLVVGRARVLLPRSSAGVWVTIGGQLRAAALAGRAGCLS